MIFVNVDKYIYQTYFNQGYSISKTIEQNIKYGLRKCITGITLYYF